jgi:hypothetical protein
LNWAGRNRSKLRTLRVFIPVASFWVVVNVPSYDWYHGSIFGLVLYWTITGSFADHSSNSIFPLTFAFAMITFFFAVVRLRRFKVDWFSTLLLAMSMPFAFVGGFEAVYQNLGFFFRSDVFRIDTAGQILLCSWVLLGLATAPYWRITLKAILSAAVIIIGFGFWVAFGYPQIYETGALSEYALALNIITKFAFFLLFFVLLYDGTKSSGSSIPIRITTSRLDSAESGTSMRGFFVLDTGIICLVLPSRWTIILPLICFWQDRS